MSTGFLPQSFPRASLESKDNISLCSRCMGFSDVDPCALCSDSSRDAGLVCVVSDFKDMAALENSGHFTGVYHILHGNLAPLKGVGPGRDKRSRSFSQELVMG